MSVNKFWGTSKSIKNNITKGYVDKKFINLATSLSTKANKHGETFSGDIHMGNNKITSNYVAQLENDLVNKKYIDSLISLEVGGISLNSKLKKSGGEMSGPLIMGLNKVTSNYVPRNDEDLVNKKHLDEVAAHRLGDDDLRIIMNNLSLKVAKAGDTMTGNLNMGYNKITCDYTPLNENDLINKRYLNLNYVASSVGYIPDLVGNNNDSSGFTVSASSELATFPPFCAFNRLKLEWRVRDNSNMWIQVKCPQPVRLFQFALRGKTARTDRVLRWKLEASRNGTTWVELYSTTTNHLSNEIKFFQPTSSPLALYYKITFIEAEGTNPG